ncbi:MAG: hypothetical protein QOK40_301 [Miltoncostaeaceae bacterium]|jgi:hypothetical protein|nr:hypothetical protein [Miltoncostaeaceae bacterium]
MIEQAVEELTPLVGTRPACRALGASHATIYLAPAPARAPAAKAAAGAGASPLRGRAGGGASRAALGAIRGLVPGRRVGDAAR